jgi:adenylate kinase family enzyme
MVKQRLMQPDVEQNGWLLDGYPRSLSQAMALENLGIRPDIFILLEVVLCTDLTTLLACIFLQFILIRYYLENDLCMGALTAAWTKPMPRTHVKRKRNNLIPFFLLKKTTTFSYQPRNNILYPETGAQDVRILVFINN